MQAGRRFACMLPPSIKLRTRLGASDANHGGGPSCCSGAPESWTWLASVLSTFSLPLCRVVVIVNIITLNPPS